MELITTKNIILYGGSSEARRESVGRIQEAFLKKWPSSSVFTLSEHLGSSEKYLKSARKEFPVKPKLKGQNKYDMGYDQLNDSYLDWISDFKSVLIILPEFDKLYRKEPEYFYQVIGDYLAKGQSVGNRTVIRFLMTLAKERAIDISRIPVLIGGNWRPSENDIEIISAGSLRGQS